MAAQTASKGDAGNDTLLAGAGRTTLDGGTGDDRLIGGGGADALEGATASIGRLRQPDRGLVVSLATPASNTGIALGDSFTSIEGAGRRHGNDTLSGDGGANRLGGNLGNDSLAGAGWADTLNGGEGNDSLDGVRGDDLLNGGAGFDRAFYTGAGAVTVISASRVNRTPAGLDTLLDIEAVTSGSGDDSLRAMPCRMRSMAARQ